MNAPQALAEAAHELTLESLRAQNAELLARAQAMQEFIRTVPALLTSARLDAIEGEETLYNYGKHNALLATL